ncbi:MAG: glycoside hydrolase family 9 protein [Opitutales bacterium]
MRPAALPSKQCLKTRRNRCGGAWLSYALACLWMSPVLHGASQPQVVGVRPAGEHLLVVDIVERTFQPASQVPYQAQPADQIVRKQGHHLRWHEGQPAIQGPTVVQRPNASGRLVQAGELVAGDSLLTLGASTSGDRLEGDWENPASFELRETARSGASDPAHPHTIHRKSKPFQAANGGPRVRHQFFLEFEQPLREGTAYTLSLPGLNVSTANIDYRHAPRQDRSPAVQVSHVGFRPTDPYKRAFLSLWRGTGGAHAFDGAGSFELLDADSRQSVYRGRVELILSPDQKENLRGENRCRTFVYVLDFSDFEAPGAYVVHVPGVGCSFPFRIAEDTWTQAFQTSMHGLLTHRSGLALEAPWTDYARPRPMHPADDGFMAYQIDATTMEGESKTVRKAFLRQLAGEMDASKLTPVPEAWGGYMDAGDWDRRARHLEPTLRLLELYALYPERLQQIRLALPPAEAANNFPDLLDEALWNVDLYARLQLPDGGVRGGIESTEHPFSGEASWQESLLVGVFAADPESSAIFAAAAARASRLVAPFNARRAQDLRASAIAAWDWIETNGEACLRGIVARGEKTDLNQLRRAVRQKKTLAAVELYHLTGDARYHQTFLKDSFLLNGEDGAQEIDALFAYTQLPENLGQPDARRQARAFLLRLADQSLGFGQGNAYGITMRAPLPVMGFVGYYGTPETVIGPLLPRAYALTGEAKYLEGALRAAQFSVGANPMNHTLTTGLGHAWPLAPLHVDSKKLGLPTPRGITVYGNTDLKRAPQWVKQWHLGPYLVPDWQQWPSAEAYIDLGNWPEVNEYTIHQSIGPTAYYWGFLAVAPPPQ